jgi:energy-converting hydrogenase Eha subunit E
MMPMTTFVVTLASTATAVGIMLLSVYSGLFNAEVWTVGLCMFFLAVHPVAGWAFRRNRKG